ncbi:MAG: SLBB domain-containing protein [Ignavibacteriales bacterium]|nr:MAG: SLBB domain-containing protein [Ignavibacteriales bacterium]
MFISIRGLEEAIFNLVIDQEGFLYIPKAGGIDLNHCTLSMARNKIKNGINKNYRNVEVYISLADFRKIKVSLLGDVEKPSTYTLSANSRLIDLVVISKGLTPTANYRNIKITSRDKNEKYYDLLSFLRYGNKENNPYLKEGDIVLVDRIDEVVSIYGRIKYPGKYEFVEGESIYNLLELAGGLLSKARIDSIEVMRFSDDGKRQISYYYSFEELKNNHLKLNRQDLITVREIPDYLVDRYVRIDGFVKYPGFYKIIKDSTTLTDIIKEAGGFKKEASLTEATLTRTQGIADEDPEFERLKLIPRADMTEDEYDYLKSKSRQKTGRVVVDFVALFENADLSEDVVLKKEDVINIPESKNYIIMLGQVINPGKLIYHENLTIEDYIQLAGGFGWRALENDVRIIKARTGEWIDADDIEILEPGDTIWIPEDPPGPKFWDVFTTSLQILGQVAAVVAATIAVIVASR